MSIRRVALLPVLVALAASGCQVWTGSPAPARPDEDGNAATRRTSAVYAAVIRRLVTEDSYLYEGPIERVFVVRTAGYPDVGAESPPLSSAVERRILEALRDLPVRVVLADLGTAVVDEEPCRGPAVRKGGLLIGLGPIARARGKRVTVASWVLAGCLGKNGQRLAYVVKPKDGSWRVVGTKGPITIS